MERERGWMVAVDGVDLAEVFVAPAEGLEDGQEAWVKVRPLTELEVQEREGLGLCEEYLMSQPALGEPRIRVLRSYDLRAMAEYDFAHCVVDFCLPELGVGGRVNMRRLDPGDPAGNVEFLGRMRPPLSDWVWEAIESVNRRLPEQRAVLEVAKKNWGTAGQPG